MVDEADIKEIGEEVQDNEDEILRLRKRYERLRQRATRIQGEGGSDLDVVGMIDIRVRQLREMQEGKTPEPAERPPRLDRKDK